MENLKLHHIGVVTKNIEKEFKVFEKLGYSKVSDIFTDPIQKIKGVFISAENQPTLELLENLAPDGPLNSFIKNRIKFYHFAYISNNIEQDIELFINKYNAFLISPPPETVTYFEKICFLMLPNQMIIELVQERQKNE